MTTGKMRASKDAPLARPKRERLTAENVPNQRGPFALE